MSLNDFRAAWPASRACVADFMNGVSLNAHDFIRALQIVDCAKRLLTPEELVEALATDTQNCSINEDKKARFGDGRGLLVDHCQLGTIGKTQAEGQGPIYWDKTSQMYCAHVIKGTRGKETAADAWLWDAEAECAKVCLAYLECHPEPYHKRQSSFVVYCAKYWPSHIKAAQNNEVLNKRVMDFLTTPAAVESWLQVYDDEDATLREVLVPRRYDWLPASRSPLYHAVFHSLPVYTTLLMQSTIEVRDKEEALYAGCLIGNSDAVKALLDNGTDPNAEYGPLESTLAAAAKGGNIDIFRMLTRSGAKIPSDTDDSHPLAVAAIHGNLDIMEEILQTQDWDAKQSVLGSCLDSLSARLDGDRREEALAVLLKHVERSQKYV
ncbi:hypothetical protein PFICI_14467 [Pestalotiopsis fici W106-1]|uniref:Uncharacterized protein n=1 Tax=Pestalotiopsis fici (strain W106-1 / CGMCC3.15140) TaxID=1229662 RepID=W3WL31_PESFW|nr:uncharacterized protein PFICI_14467 [Pestalotiopsis fici W106-1]ETS73521.1 hypothetical protein PFICI_14467 [Pestalotiopsis fici W106-1]